MRTRVPTMRAARLQRLAALLLLPALLLRAVVPVGFMPDRDAGSGVAMALCTAQGLQTLRVPAAADTPADAPAAPGAPDHTQADGHCPFALSGTGLAPPLAAFAATAFMPAAAPRAVEQRADPFPPPPSRAHAARAPPLPA